MTETSNTMDKNAATKSQHDVESMARASLAHALVQLAIHFPTALEELELTAGDALAHALRLAEEAIALAPARADGHAALGRILLCHDDPDALRDSMSVLEHACNLEPENDSAQIAMAVAERENGAVEAALQRVEMLIKRGSAAVQPLVLRALLRLDRDENEPAKRDIERAVQMAPNAGVFRLDAGIIMNANGDTDAADQHRGAARELLGKTYEAVRQVIEANLDAPT